MTDLWHLRGVAPLAAVLAASLSASAEPVLPVGRAATPARRAAVVLPTTLKADAQERAAAAPLTGALDALLSDTAQDLGLSLDLTDRSAARPSGLADGEIVAHARAGRELVIAPSIEVRGDEVELRIALAVPSSRTLRVRVERVAREDVAVRAAVMMRDLIDEPTGGARAGRPAAGAPGETDGGDRWPPHAADRRAGLLVTPAPSEGKATLVANATLYGGALGYSIQRSSGSDDPRLLYPLLAVGAGIGLGGAIIIAEEWDVGLGDAWFLSSGVWWPTVAGHLIHAGRFAAHADDADQERWASGVIGGATGGALATLGLALGRMSDGGALTAHSGGGLGLVLGGLVEWAVTGDVDSTPVTGMGYGAAFGWLAAATTARQLDAISTSRVLAINLGALLGGLGGAALASPLVFESPTQDQQRAWVGATAGGLLLGAGAAWFATRGSSGAQRGGEERPSWMRAGLPMIGVLGESVAGSRRAPALGLGWQGALP